MDRYRGGARKRSPATHFLVPYEVFKKSFLGDREVPVPFYPWLVWTFGEMFTLPRVTP